MHPCLFTYMGLFSILVTINKNKKILRKRTWSTHDAHSTTGKISSTQALTVRNSLEYRRHRRFPYGVCYFMNNRKTDTGAVRCAHGHLRIALLRFVCTACTPNNVTAEYDGELTDKKRPQRCIEEMETRGTLRVMLV